VTVYSPPLAIAVGLAAGVLSGAFGIGGGLVTTPAIRLLFQAPPLIAVGTPLPIVIPTALAGAVSYRGRGLADVRAGVIVGLAGSGTSVAGAYLSDLVGGSIVMLLTAALILYMAGDMLRPRSILHDHAEEGPGAALRSAAASCGGLVALGAAAGLYSGLLGLGGGFVLVPMLRRWLRYPIKRAIGTSLVAVTILAVPGSAAHWALGHVDVRLALLLAVGVVPGAVLGARLTALAHERHVEIAFAVVLVVTGAVLALNEAGLLR
jgi:hypothetical protein